MMTAGERGMRIAELAAALGLNPKTIRYYEEIGLLPPPERSGARYRLYGPADRERLRFIGKAKAVGLSLGEIREVLALRDAGRRPCEHVVDLLDRKVAAVDAQLRALEAFRGELVAMRAEAARTATAEACVCGIIEHASGRGLPDLPATRALAAGRGRR
jgi:DNA-binding transcriptional MerR regulator